MNHQNTPTLPGMESYTKKNDICLLLFVDERKNIGTDKNWLYVGILFLPTLEIPTLINKLDEARKQLDFHNELKFSAIKSTKGQKILLAQKWG